MTFVIKGCVVINDATQNCGRSCIVIPELLNVSEDFAFLVVAVSNVISMKAIEPASRSKLTMCYIHTYISRRSFLRNVRTMRKLF